MKRDHRNEVIKRCASAAVYQRGKRFAVVQYWPDEGMPLSMMGCWCKTPEAAWKSADLRYTERRPGPGGNGNR